MNYINNIVDNEKSAFYLINKRKRNFWHNRSESISCRVRDKDIKSNAITFSMNIRAYLLNEDQKFNVELDKIIEEIVESDERMLQMYVYSKYQDTDRATIDKNIGLFISSLSNEEIKDALALQEVVSCRLLGYEKELFYLKCYSSGILPVFMLRCLYHLQYSHSKFRNEVDPEEYGDLEKGLHFEYLLKKINFNLN